MTRIGWKQPFLWLLVGLSSPTAHALVASTPITTVRPVAEATIDYSAANEYVQAHYVMSSYFPSNKKRELIFDARQGVYDDDEKAWKPASMESCGFTLLDAPTLVANWKNLDHVRDVYLPELRNILESTLEGISHVVFWHPMLRSEEQSVPTRPNDRLQMPRANVAQSPHIDIDVCAYESVEQLIDMIQNNNVEEDASFDRDGLVHSLEKGCRFAIVNAWRNVASTPVARAPLALLASKYTDPSKAFPVVSPDPINSRWYIFSSMIPEELLLFRQYDRDVASPSDLWHVALTSVGDAHGPPRQSFDLRCLIVFSEVVPLERDRFSKSRPSSILSQRQSQSFCSEQAKRWPPSR